MLKIYIARHGQNEDNAEGILNGHRDRPLTEIGVSQAKELAQHIKDTPLIFDKVYSSPLLRAYTTGEIVTDTLNIEKPIKLDLLIERDFGSMTGKLITDIETLCAPDIIKTDTVIYFLSPEGAETFPDLFKRGQTVLTWVREHHTDGDVLLTCHSDIGKMIYAAFYNLSWQEVLTNFHFGNSELLLLSEGCEPDKRHVLKLEQFNH